MRELKAAKLRLRWSALLPRSRLSFRNTFAPSPSTLKEWQGWNGRAWNRWSATLATWLGLHAKYGGVSVGYTLFLRMTIVVFALDFALSIVFLVRRGHRSLQVAEKGMNAKELKT